jgi:protein phosphatase
MIHSSYRFDTGSATHPGKVRSRNEDSHLVRNDAGLWAVADGMGGHEAGDVASQLVVKALDGIAAPDSALDLLEQAEARVHLANRQIVELSRQRGGAIIGSTVTILLIADDHFACIWAGDSRLYLVSNNAISQVSRDHTEAEEMLARGAVTAEEAERWPSNIITRAVGVQDQAELDVVTGAFNDADIFVLCSDGLNRHVSDQEICHVVTTRDAQAASTELVALAVERGGLDNVTVVVVQPTRQATDDGQMQATAGQDLPRTNIWE